ncbi:MAG: RND transporter, partial [Betaproteobacteria bacterium]
MKFIALSLITLLLAGCAASLPAIDPAALPAAPQSFKEGDGRWTLAAPAEAQPRGEWWRSFSDPVLDELVERAN